VTVGERSPFCTQHDGLFSGEIEVSKGDVSALAPFDHLQSQIGGHPQHPGHSPWLVADPPPVHVGPNHGFRGHVFRRRGADYAAGEGPGGEEQFVVRLGKPRRRGSHTYTTPGTSEMMTPSARGFGSTGSVAVT
jgi:hypothetical protein